MLKLTLNGPKRVDLKLPVTCPSCGSKTEIAMRDAAPGTTIACPCGVSVKLTGDDGREIQEAMDSLVDTFNRIGKR